MEFTIFKLLILYIAAADTYHSLHHRVLKGKDNVNNEFPFVVNLQTDQSMIKGRQIYRSCTGILVATEWVLTAGHCFNNKVKLIRYGNMSIPNNATSSKRKILKMIRHPSYTAYSTRRVSHIQNDIGLLLIEKTPISRGILSGEDYQTLLGLKVVYAGFGLSIRLNRKHLHEKLNITEQAETKMLQLGEGLVIPCSHVKTSWGPAICIVAKCTSRFQTAYRGDSGGPIISDGKVVGLISGSIMLGEILATPVSPYINWINKMMSPNQ